MPGTSHTSAIYEAVDRTGVRYSREFIKENIDIMSLTDEILAGDIANVEHLMRAKVDVNELDEYGYTPLIEAAIADNTEIAQLLLHHGAKVNEPDLTGGTALHWAVENHNLDLCKLLLDKGADPNAYTRYSQPILIQPLLRRQQDLKELLYRYGADLKFAQDYINTKLIGHRFELLGKVDILNSQNTFIEMYFEGFIPEFTVSVMQDSLAQFKNNYAARNLRSHFGEFQKIIEAFMITSEMIKYQQYLADINRHRKRLEAFTHSNLMLMPVGYEGHSITFIKHQNLLAKCDRGENSLYDPSVAIYSIGNPRAFNADFVKRLMFDAQNSRYVTTGVVDELNLDLLTDMPLSSQLSGNCSWANMEAAIPAMFLMLWLAKNPHATETDMKPQKDIAMAIFNQWLEWDKDWALHQCVESFYDANPARKASKAAVLAAVLFQSCRYTSPVDVSRANKILTALATPGYEYVLQSYLKVYQGTEMGKNLEELMDLYSK